MKGGELMFCQKNDYKTMECAGINWDSRLDSLTLEQVFILGQKK